MLIDVSGSDTGETTPSRSPRTNLPAPSASAAWLDTIPIPFASALSTTTLIATAIPTAALSATALALAAAALTAALAATALAACPFAATTLPATPHHGLLRVRHYRGEFLTACGTIFTNGTGVARRSAGLRSVFTRQQCPCPLATRLPRQLGRIGPATPELHATIKYLISS